MVKQFVTSRELSFLNTGVIYTFIILKKNSNFSGTGYEVWGNCNAPRAITLSALIYCLRCIVGRDVPLNQVSLSSVFSTNYSKFSINSSLDVFVQFIRVA